MNSTNSCLTDQGQNVVEGHKTIAIHGVDYKTTSAFFHCIQFDEKMTNDCIFLSEDKQKKAEFTLSSELVDQFHVFFFTLQLIG